MKTPVPLIFAAMSLISTSYADVKLPSIFGDHMVLQQEMKIPVWGTAEAGEKISVTVGDHNASTTTGPDGKWRVNLDPFISCAEPVTMTVQGKNTVVFRDVLIGDVWLASGQSNMEVSVAYAYNAKDVVPKAADKQLRLFLTARKTALEPLGDVTSPFSWQPAGGSKPLESDGDRPGTWIVCEPHSASNFSAVAYFFGRELRSHLNRPIGLIGSYWGGTMAEAWTSLSGLQKDPPFTTYIQARQQNVEQFPKLNAEYEKAHPGYVAEMKDYEAKLNTATEQYQATAKEWQAATKKAVAEGQPTQPKLDLRPAFPPKPKAPARPDGGAFGPANLYNGMIAPLIPYAIKGVIWYQGESNTRNKALEYRLLFPRLIADWREKWGEGDFPFLYVQISHFPYAADGSSALVREAQLRALAVPDTGMAVTVDIPCDDAGHPHDKEDPAKRLALIARHIAYGEDIVYSGPLYDSMKVEGGAIRINFKKPGDGLIIGTTPYQPSAMGSQPLTPLPTDKLVGFTIAGKDKKFVPADAKIDGDTVVVSNPQVANPAAVRFAWGDKVDCNLYNKDNLPASPFRTDEWNDFVYHDLIPGAPPPTFFPSMFVSGKH
ncbi:MAG: sialate O-acetylesterase [Chthoniobacteraceae bacterium]